MTVVDLIHTALEAHDVSSTIQDDVVRLTGSDLEFEPRVFDGPPNEHSEIVQLDIVARSRRIAPHYVVESMAGVGSDRSSAERDAFGRFLLGSFHVLLTVLADHSCPSNPAEWLTLEEGGASWRVCDGPLLVQGPDLDSTTYPDFLKQLEELFLSSVSAGPHWVRVFVGSFQGKVSGLEVLLDNEPWAEAVALVNQWDWRCPEEYRSLRHFFMALPNAR